jgi:ActR/RegA family two-component response regulator
MPNSRRKRILFVDDEPSLRATLPAVLRQNGFEVDAAESVTEAIQAISNERFDVLISDLNIGEPGDGFTVVSAMRRMQPDAVTFILTGYPDFETALTAIRNQVDDYLTKPADVETLVSSLKQKLSGRSKHVPLQVKHCSALLRENADMIMRTWLQSTKAIPRLAALHLSDADRLDDLPDMLREVIRAIDERDSTVTDHAAAAACKHGETRRAQGYTVPLVVKEARIFQRTIADLMQTHLLALDMSQVIPSLVVMSESVNAQLELSFESFSGARNIA